MKELTVIDAANSTITLALEDVNADGHPTTWLDVFKLNQLQDAFGCDEEQLKEHVQSIDDADVGKLSDHMKNAFFTSVVFDGCTVTFKGTMAQAEQTEEEAKNTKEQVDDNTADDDEKEDTNQENDEDTNEEDEEDTDQDNDDDDDDEDEDEDEDSAPEVVMGREGVVTVYTSGGLQQTHISVINGETTLHNTIYNERVRARSGMTDTQLSNCIVLKNDVEVKASALKTTKVQDGDSIVLSPRVAHTKGC